MAFGFCSVSRRRKKPQDPYQATWLRGLRTATPTLRSMNPAFAGTLDLRIDGTGSLSRGISPFFVWFFGERSRGCALCHLKRLGKERSNLLKWLILLAVFTIDIATRPAITAQMLRKTASSPFVRRLAGLLLGAAHLHAFNGRNRTPRASGFLAGRAAHHLTALPTVVSRAGFILDGFPLRPCNEKSRCAIAQRLDNLLSLVYHLLYK